MKRLFLPLTLALGGLAPTTTRANVQLPAIFSDHMVLQKAARVPVWGKADPGEEVGVSLGDQTVRTTAGPDGKWLVALNLENSAAGPYEVLVKGRNQIRIADVVVGEVWIGAGQSNMEFVIKNTIDAEKEVAASANPLLRQFRVDGPAVPQPAEDCKGSWVLASPATTGSFIAVAYYFGKILQKELQVPVGIISANWGGTPVEAWTSQAAIDSVPDLKQARERLWKEQDAYGPAREAYVRAFEKWAQEFHREDVPTKDVAAYAGEKVDLTSWTSVKLPGPIQGTDLPEEGVIWLRTEINVPAASAGQPLRLDFGRVNSFLTFYWNGRPIQDLPYQKFPGQGFRLFFYVPADQVKAGRNVAAFRFYFPSERPQLPDAIRSSVPVPSNWLAKSELVLPPLEADAKTVLPKLAAPSLAQNVPSYDFNGRINPIIPYAIKGVVWYQGESNVNRAYQYRTAFPLLIEDWRKRWAQGPFPFYFCQLANYLPKQPEPVESSWAELREAQTLTQKLPHTAEAILIDLGEAGDIHPRHKEPVGERLARIALANDYGKNSTFSGPTYESMKVEDGKVRITFAHATEGLVARPLPVTYDVKTLTGETAPVVRNSPQGDLEGFALCGADRKWVWATAKIEGNDVVVWSDKVPVPVAVRYAWADNPTCNLFNGAGLPAGPFRTDDFPLSTLAVKY